MKVHGTAGAHALKLAERRTRRRRVLSVALLVSAAFALASGRWLIALAIGLMVLAVRNRLTGRAYAARVGAIGEAAVADRLRSLRPSVLLLGLDLRGHRGDIDAVVLGPMIATVEVKAATGRIRPMTDGRLRVGRKWLPGHPLAQAASHAASVGRFTPEFVEAILCVTNMRGRPRYVEYHAEEVLVTSARHLPRVIRRLPKLLDERQARRLARNLQAGNSTSHEDAPSVH